LKKFKPKWILAEVTFSWIKIFNSPLFFHLFFHATLRRCQTTNKGCGFCGWVKSELKQGLDLVSAEENKVHEKGEVYNLAEAKVK
jgi:hypothetical protein